MPYLAIDTSNFALSLAVGDDRQCLGEASTFVDRNHSNRLMPLLESLLRQVEIGANELTGIIVGKGPGSYTGVRIGVTAAKTLAWSLKIPLVGVSSLEAMAYTAAWSGYVTCPLIDARRRQVYGCAISIQQPAGDADEYRSSERLIQEAVWPIELFLKRAAALKRSLVFVGTGAAVHRDFIREKLGEQAHFPMPLSTGYSRALHLLEIGSRFIRNGQTEDPFSFAPEYLQAAEAEAKLKQHQEKGFE